MNENNEENEKTLFSTRIDSELLERFRRYCKKQKRTISGQIELVLEEFLEKEEDKKS